MHGAYKGCVNGSKRSHCKTSNEDNVSHIRCNERRREIRMWGLVSFFRLCSVEDRVIRNVCFLTWHSSIMEQAVK
ncbi:hypothetical protein MTR_7g012875 [Medicago truncatula]|uniref:Uncharacterized protein n=1 Tax=Medicago truncatula TaxID=3880 RepID=A0A072TXP2_MEDTR|nr:hypothetical protein MTR_7g012875 [Medicago truncatula]